MSQFSSNVVFLAILALYFYSGYLYNHCFLLLNVLLVQNIKNLVDNASFFVFSHNIGPNLAYIFPLRLDPLCYFADFQWNVLRNSININSIDSNNWIESSSSETKLIKLLRITIFEPNLHKKGVSMGHP